MAINFISLSNSPIHVQPNAHLCWLYSHKSCRFCQMHGRQSPIRLSFYFLLLSTVIAVFLKVLM